MQGVNLCKSYKRYKGYRYNSGTVVPRVPLVHTSCTCASRPLVPLALLLPLIPLVRPLPLVPPVSLVPVVPLAHLVTLIPDIDCACCTPCTCTSYLLYPMHNCSVIYRHHHYLMIFIIPYF